MSRRLEEKIAVVTGASGAIGTVICEKFATEGASVVLVDINREGLEKVFESFSEKHGNRHLQLCGDATDSSFIEQCFQRIQEKYGKAGDVLVNCAGGSPKALFIDTTEEMFDEVVNLNLKTVFLMTKAFVASLKTKDGFNKASIINISSMAAKSGAPHYSVYAACKAGIIAFSKTIGAELGGFGIRCNSILPGFTVTEGTTKAFGEEEREFMRQLAPLKKLGYPEDVANVCIFLASDESSHMTCGSLEVAGGSGA